MIDEVVCISKSARYLDIYIRIFAFISNNLLIGFIYHKWTLIFIIKHKAQKFEKALEDQLSFEQLILFWDNLC